MSGYLDAIGKGGGGWVPGGIKVASGGGNGKG